jgi:hypothetical protein
MATQEVRRQIEEIKGFIKNGYGVERASVWSISLNGRA